MPYPLCWWLHSVALAQAAPDDEPPIDAAETQTPLEAAADVLAQVSVEEGWRALFVTRAPETGLVGVPASEAPAELTAKTIRSLLRADLKQASAQGHDLYLAREALPVLGRLPEKHPVNTFLAYPEGSNPDLRIRDGQWEVEVVPKLWATVVDAAADEDDGLGLAFKAAARELVDDATELAVVDKDCAEQPERAASVEEASARAISGDVVLTVVDGDLPASEAIVAWSRMHDVDLVVVQASTCGGDVAADVDLEPVLRPLRTAPLAAVWQVGLPDDGERVFSAPRRHGERLVLDAPGLVMVFHEDRLDQPPVELPPATAQLLGPKGLDRRMWFMYLVFGTASLAAFGGLGFMARRSTG